MPTAMSASDPNTYRLSSISIHYTYIGIKLLVSQPLPERLCPPPSWHPIPIQVIIHIQCSRHIGMQLLISQPILERPCPPPNLRKPIQGIPSGSLGARRPQQCPYGPKPRACLCVVPSCTGPQDQRGHIHPIMSWNHSPAHPMARVSTPLFQALKTSGSTSIQF
jgi:hypothetical protein